MPAKPASNEAAAKAAFAKLDTLKVSIDFEDTPLTAAVEYMKQVSGVNILIDKAVTDEREIDETRITLQVNDVSLRSALSLVLDFSNLVVRWRHSVLMITTPSKGRGKPVARMYDVRDITLEMKDFPGPTIKLEASEGNQSVGIGGLGDEPESQAPSRDQIMDLIQELMPEDFEVEGTSITTFGNAILIRQSPEVHAKITAILSLPLPHPFNREVLEMIRPILFTLALAGLLGLAPLANAGDRVPVSAPDDSPQAKATWAKLDTQKISLDLSDAPVSEAFRFIRQTSGLNLVVDGAVKQERDLDEERVNLQVDDVPLRSALSLLCDFTGLVARWKHGVLLITTEARGHSTPLLRIYDVRDITFKITGMPGPTMELSSGTGMDDLGSDPFGNEEDENPPPTQDEIVELITGTLPEAFEIPGTSISQLGSVLVINQSREVHMEIQRVLAMLRASR
ncbi:MAG: hypothetical protein ACYTGX_02335 [Planctomycetota bacterium]